MLRSLTPRGLRGRLTGSILLVAAVVLAGSLYALHERTGEDLSDEVDNQLRSDAAEFANSPAAHSSDRSELQRRGVAFVAGQGYHGDSRIFVIAIGNGDAVITNEQGAISGERGEQRPELPDGDDAATGILGAPTGLATIEAPDGGRLRVLSEPVAADGRSLGTFHVAQSLGPIGTAQGSLRDTALIVGFIAIIVLTIAALWIATLVARPLSRMAEFATDIDTAGLNRRLSETEGPSEVRSLAHSFNRMLDRLKGAFDREREFVADASHELRTPMTIAQGELDLLRRDLDPGRRERIDVVRRELRRMERLVAEMLTLADQEAEVGSRDQSVDVGDLLSDLRRDLPLMGSRRYEVAELGGTVKADPDRLAQVFRNLLRNAVAHTNDGGRVQVMATTVGDRVRFEILDDGAGFSQVEAEHLFDRFYRTDAGRSRDRGGSGLGLAIARSIVEAHHGRIWATSTNGAAGGRVIFELPGYRAPG